MGNISGLRDAADMLLEQRKYKEAYDIYDEVYNQLWSAIGYAQSGISEFSFGYLTHNIRSAVDFRGSILQPALNTTFIKWFDLDIDQTLNEFIFCTYGHLRCLTMSRGILETSSGHIVLSEFLMLYNLIIHNADDSWGNQITKIMTPLLDGMRLKKIRPNFAETSLSKLLIQAAEKIVSTDWENLNSLLLDYLYSAPEDNQSLYEAIFKIIPGRKKHTGYQSRQNWQKQDRREKQQQETYEKYEKYERYEKYEKYESGGSAAGSNTEDKNSRSGNTADDKHSDYRETHSGTNNSGSSSKQNGSKSRGSHQRSSHTRPDFDISTATDEQKARYYGRILGLEGRVTRSDIRKKYLEAISKYHPDRVQNLGEDLLELAERRTKEINVAYDWFRIKFNIT